MTKDEACLAVMGAISMALKSPKLQQGFEIICKNLSELEKENAELNDKLNNLASVAKVRLANWQKYADAYNETQELLDKQIETTYKVVEKLNKAKGIVKALLNVFVYDLAENELDSVDIFYIERAEKFLKE